MESRVTGMVGMSNCPKPPQDEFHLWVYVHDHESGGGFEQMQVWFHEYSKLADVAGALAQYLGHPLSRWWGEHHEGLLQSTQTEIHAVKNSKFNTFNGDENLLARVLAYSNVMLIVHNCPDSDVNVRAVFTSDSNVIIRV